jgi:hypothetical protein
MQSPPIPIGAQARALAVVVLTAEQLRELVAEAVSHALAAQASRPTSSTPALLSRHELAHALGISAASVGRLTVEGMACVYVGKAPRYSLDEVRAYLDARGQRGTKATKSPARELIPGVRCLSRAR